MVDIFLKLLLFFVEFILCLFNFVKFVVLCLFLWLFFFDRFVIFVGIFILVIIICNILILKIDGVMKYLIIMDVVMIENSFLRSGYLLLEIV